MTYRILRNANILPPEVEAMKEVRTLQDALAEEEDPERRAELTRQIHKAQILLKTRLEGMARRR